MAVLGGIKVSPVNGMCAHPKCSCRNKGCVDLLEEMSPFRLEHLEAGLLESPHGVICGSTAGACVRRDSSAEADMCLHRFDWTTRDHT